MTLKISLVRGAYYEDKWAANIEVDESTTLEDLHYAIQVAVEFDNDHLYCYFLSRSDRSAGREYFNDENELIYTKTLQKMFPTPEKKSLYYLFDWGDEWVFKISQSRKPPHEPEEGVTYPRIVSETGIKPVQYGAFGEDDG